MKKLACLILALALCISSSAMADTIPSKTTADLTKFDVVVENQPQPGEPHPYLLPVNELTFSHGLPHHERQLEILRLEIAKLSRMGIDSYFATATDSNGRLVDLRTMLGLEAGAALNVFEFCEVVAGGFEEDCGMVTATMLFPTPYEKGEKVDVLIGIVTLLGDDAYTVDWQAFKGVGMDFVTMQEETHGSIRSVFTPEIVWAIENGIALLAVVSN